MRVSILHPCRDVLDDCLFVGGAFVQTLRGEDVEFALRQIEPTSVLWRVMPFKAFDEPPRLGGGESFVKRRRAMGV